MIQKTTQRQLNAALGYPMPSVDGLDVWGQWVRDRHYSLEVTQHPIRARMCGFGDKDRRPLAPAAVAKLIVRQQDNTILEPDDIDLDFFVVTVDLWSADGTRDMNLVLHPKGTGPPEHMLTTSVRHGPYHPQPLESPPSLPGPSAAPSSYPSFPFSQHPDLLPDTSASWAYLPNSPTLHTVNSTPPGPSSAAPDIPLSAPDSRPWKNEHLARAIFVPAEPFAVPADLWSTPAQACPPPSTAPAPPPPPPDGQRNSQPPPPPPPHQRQSFTRTLVGPLCANAQRLQDEHRKPGIFFLFQDLSIRTEGTFRLRMRLMNIGVSPSPNGPANSVHTGVSPVLAQIFTEPFTVYSAKRFPGVPDTTALSIAFGNQGQKLPLRNKFGPSKKPRRPRLAGEESSEDDYS